MSDEILTLDQAHGNNWSVYQADCVHAARQLPDSSIDLALFSPPFSNLYTYSDSPRDMGNTENDEEFMTHFSYLIKELFRIIRPGRLCAVHCKDLVNYRGRDGESGLRDLPGELIRAFKSAGFAWHSRITIWTDPVSEMQRTNAHGLLYKQLRTDSTFSRQGMPEYVLIFRRWPKDETEEALIRPVPHEREDFPLTDWQEYASPVWMTVRRTNVLNVALGREDKDERHMCPLQLDIIERAVKLWSNPGDVVFSPFLGVGSEGVGALKLKRKFIGTELKASYFAQAVKFLTEEERDAQGTLFR